MNGTTYVGHPGHVKPERDRTDGPAVASWSSRRSVSAEADHELGNEGERLPSASRLMRLSRKSFGLRWSGPDEYHGKDVFASDR